MNAVCANLRTVLWRKDGKHLHTYIILHKDIVENVLLWKCIQFCSFESRYITEFFLQESPRDVSEFADVVGGGGIFSVNLKRKKN